MSAPTFALGTHVITTAEAWLARKKDGKWFLPKRGNYNWPATNGGEHSSLTISVVTSPIHTVRLEHIQEPKEKDNKSVVVGEFQGSGVIIGLERKMLGESVGGYEDDPGYLLTRGHVDLYVVKTDFKVRAYYVPEGNIFPQTQTFQIIVPAKLAPA